ncbi:domain of unknown function DUF1731 [Beutenbergia cavernae DSM 12333]|uniref:NAD-dependent epimerase/dehydratase n=1 Tax=Beutenbergia cavernae (strain ATCC BAA-8 / DSM 12333 / CCUG 43141 / JCM 11478 / NBRC 16432 / NCIMB 13614 / HKI 0122) TaxID=471853 RepID=C5C4Y9_BEUC1|nr:TIGR01777 family oxidoreductase [Beutenbergia cavernae]ACQ80117.1 domain of unknown function DUF1731 [Beutenbergia cavernae DSM 12333]
MPDVLLAGASGLLGPPLGAELRRRGFGVRRLVRRTPAAPDEVRWDPSSGEVPREALGELDDLAAVVVLSGAGVGEHRWTPEFRRTIVASRVDPVGAAAHSLVVAGAQHVRLVAASAVGYYGDGGEQVLTESSPSGSTFLAGVCRAWESAADDARAAGIAVAHLRTGVVLARRGGALGRLMPLVRLGLGGPLGNGRQWWPWISALDAVRAIAHLATTSDLVGPVNVTAPNPRRNAEVVAALARGVHRPAVLGVPAPALRLGLGAFADELLASQRVIPAALESSGFAFAHRHLDDAVEWLVR